MRIWVRAGAWLAAAGLLALAAGFAWFVAVAESPGVPPPHADGIVALTGGADRIGTAFRLLEDGRAEQLLVSGVAHSAALPDLARLAGLDPAALAPRVTLGRAATSTYGNAEETAEWVSEHGIRSLIVVTAGYHMPRALLELRRAMPGVALHPVPVQPAGMHDSGTLRLLVTEYARLIAAFFGLSRIVHGGRPGWVWIGVDNSVGENPAALR